MRSCERCDLGDATYIIFSKVIFLLVCKRCAEVAEKLPHKEPGRVYIRELSNKKNGKRITMKKKNRLAVDAFLSRLNHVTTVPPERSQRLIVPLLDRTRDNQKAAKMRKGARQ